MSGHIALLGDSIFDNRAYTGREPDVIGHLRALLPSSWRASLCAVDGSTTESIKRQVLRVPADASRLVISVGGNDALRNADLLLLPSTSTVETLTLFGDRVERFETAYRTAIQSALALGQPTTLCTVYNGNLDPAQARVARIALMMFNDVILRVAFEHRLAVIDLRLICNTPSDYANPIEPSGQGGRKIAQAIAQAVGALPGQPSQVFINR